MRPLGHQLKRGHTDSLEAELGQRLLLRQVSAMLQVEAQVLLELLERDDVLIADKSAWTLLARTSYEHVVRTWSKPFAM